MLKATTFFRSTFRRKVLIVSMIIILLYAYFLVRFIPLKLYFNKYLVAGKELDTNGMQPYWDEVRLIRKLARIMPLKVTCLMESLAVRLHFKRQGIQIPLYIGVKTGTQLEAHAWNFKDLSGGFCALNNK